MSMLLTANTFLITAPTVNCTPSLQFLGSNNQNSSAVLTGTNAVLQTLSSNEYGNSVAMISRLGHYDILFNAQNNVLF